MDQLLTTLWSRGGWFRAFTPPPTVDDAPQGTPILDVPSDILLLIGDYLNDSEILSFKLTCRSTYALFPQTFKALPPYLKKRFLPMIEKDPLGKGTVYCHPCNRLHPFVETTGPQSGPELGVDGKRLKCMSRDRFSPTGNPFTLSYIHARLAMNRHLYGPEYGIPLANLCTEQSERRDLMTVQCSTSAKIMDDELFLQRTYVLTVAGGDVAEFRKCTGARDFKLCEHTSFFPATSPFRHSIPELLKKPATGGDGLVPCCEAPGSCGLCLMDYDITIQPCADESYRIVIRATHQVGACRSPRDWKWARFSECYRVHIFYPSRPNRRGSAYRPGSLHKQWADDEREACAVLDGGSGNMVRGLFGLSFLS
ncbi:hypothetical protein TrVFT333_001257 [Trichoderma virens FT-333]|nr:hypothetical protein TrVFT333_001257 [Trichoderma virens FT-333]